MPAARTPLQARVRCRGGNFSALRRVRAAYASCAEAGRQGDLPLCPQGCLGLGDCRRRCERGAIVITPAGVAAVDPELCHGCGRCLAACPRRLLILGRESEMVFVACRSHQGEEGQGCPRGCTGCGRCLTACPQGAIALRNFLAVIDRSRCLNCGLCAEWCPRHCIVFRSRGGRFAAGNPLFYPLSTIPHEVK